MLLEDREAPARAVEDIHVARLRQYLRSGRPAEELAARHPTTYEVDRVFQESRGTRWLLEAMVCAGVSPHEISRRFGWQTPAVIDEYELLKFDVRGRLGCDAYVISSLLGVTDQGSMAPSEERLLKLLGWVGARRGLGSALLDGYVNLDAMPEDTRQWYERFIDGMLTRKTARAMLKFDPATMPTVTDLIRTWAESRRDARAALVAGTGMELTGVEESQKALLASLTISVASLSAPPVTGVEPRALEAVQIALRKQLEGRASEAGNKQQDRQE